MQMRTFFVVPLAAVLAFLLGCGNSPTTPAKGPGPPAIVFTSVPKIGSDDNLKGTVTGLPSCDYSVAVFIFVDNEWWVKPFANAQLTPINCGNGEWSANIVTGGNDAQATQIVAFVVPSSDTSPWSTLIVGPPLALPDSIASTSASRTP